MTASLYQEQKSKELACKLGAKLKLDDVAITTIHNNFQS